jgi:MoaA/NifB/PqqE/SkfB family radical SAM enzyme
MGGEISLDRFAQVLEKLIREGAIDSGSVLSLYNWGEPFLHRDLPGIIRIINEQNVRYALSTNAYRVPAIDREFVRNLDHLIFSMCGFSQASYDRIQQTNFDKARDNITRIVKECRGHGFKGEFRIFFHIYKFNEGEVEPCKKFANRLGILFHPHYAILNRWDDLGKLATGRMPPEALSGISDDLHGLNEIPGFLLKKEDSVRGHHCPQFEYLVLTENGDVVACCQLPKDRPEFLCGNILNDTLTDILKRRQEMPVCEDCIRTGLASYINRSIKVPASYRRGLRQTVLFVERKLLRIFSGRW